MFVPEPQPPIPAQKAESLAQTERRFSLEDLRFLSAGHLDGSPPVWKCAVAAPRPVCSGVMAFCKRGLLRADHGS
jgi:hypothetical protein